MNEIVEEWIRKAEGDYATACRELAATEHPNYDAVCFHAQQCVEKLLKALVIQTGGHPPKIHDLSQLLPLCPDWTWPVEELHYLSRAAVDFRYPGEEADLDEATEALEICGRIRDDLLKRLRPES
ncbi:HEPN domain-containing protein [Candidatus Sumerlaeota bacterium]|nr:HEPN domain-containing protein [Candidatus Sumerlaeota bacterium]